MNALVKRKSIALLSTLLMLFVFAGFTKIRPEEGMFPMSEISRLDLKKAGLKMNQEDIFNPGGESLTDALVRVGGCTGSFVSSEGLIITNHHCAFGSVQAASSVENDYITDGFLARRKEDEIFAKGLTCKITRSYEDVSEEIMESLQSISDPILRLKTIGQKIREIESRENDVNPGMSCEISEMFAGKNYVLFRYQIIRDVRLVYVPPRTVGEFGGESDNWEWPRHTGDFSFLRAYVAKDGSPADYSPDNVPFTPKRHLNVNANGVKDGDFLFILGYPGRTFRNQPARFIEYHEKYQLPYIADLFEEQIETMKMLGAQDKTLEIRVASRIKSLANVSKNYKGKREGLEKINLTQQKLNEDLQLSRFIESDPELKSTYGNVLPEINKLYDEMSISAKQSLWFGQILSSTTLLSAAAVLLESSEKLKDKSGDERKKLEDAYLIRLRTLLTEMHESVDKLLFEQMIRDAKALPPELQVEAVSLYFKRADTQEKRMKIIQKWWSNTLMVRPQKVYSLIGSTEETLKKQKDPVLNFVRALKKQSEELRAKSLQMQGKLNVLYAQYIDVKMKFKATSFIPDANATLRLTYGYVKGYSTQDAVFYHPITTLGGMIEKSFQGGDYTLHPKIYSLYNDKMFGKYSLQNKNDVPLAILYNTDTSGGNSGSPILDADGSLIGVNFDRAYPATINDYAWNDKYSRSIGVDIRFVLWVTQYVGEAGFLLDEMGVAQ